jgi:putative endonuclease
VYILRSEKNSDIYIGSSEDVRNRLALHNEGRVKSTKGYRPWKLLEQEEFGSRGEAVLRERFLKSHQQKEKLSEKYGLVDKW